MKILLLSHSTGIVGPIDFLEDYCIEQKNTVYKIQHPLDTYHGQYTIIYKNKKVRNRKKRNDFIFNIVIDFFYSLHSILKIRSDICIGANNFDTFVAVIARRFLNLPIQHIIYFASDFSEMRFTNSLYNFIYLQIEKYVLRNADLIISNTKRAEKRRFQLGLLQRKSLVIPNGVMLAQPIFIQKKIDKNSFIFVGSVTKEHGLLEFLDVIRPLIKHLVVIGQGAQWHELENFIQQFGLDADLYFAKSHEFVIDYLQNFSGIGLAPYNMEAKWTYYCSPLKVNEYIACGLPIIISDVPEISKKIKNENLGVVYNATHLATLNKYIDEFDINNFVQKSKKFYREYSYKNLYKTIPLINQ